MTDVAGTAPAQPALKRAIGPKLLLFFVIGDILGTGIYALMGSVAGRIGGALWLPFLLAFVVAFLTAKVTMNVRKLMPNALCVYSAAPAARGYLPTSSR